MRTKNHQRQRKERVGIGQGPPPNLQEKKFICKKIIIIKENFIFSQWAPSQKKIMAL
jgi:hypothetical protein